MGLLFLAVFGVLTGYAIVYFEPASRWAVPGLLLTGLAFVIRPLWIVGALLSVATLRLVWQAGEGIAPLELAYSLTFLLLLARTFLRHGFVAASDGEKETFKSPIALPLIVFLLLAGCTAVLAFLQGHAFVAWASDLNMILFYAFYFVIVGATRSPQELDRVFIALSLVTAFAVFRSAYEEISTRSFEFVLYGETVIKFPIASAFSLILFFVLLSIVLFMRQKNEKWFFLVLLCILFGVHQILASVRSRWLGAIAALMAIFLVTSPPQKGRFLRPLSFLALCLTFLLAVSLTVPALFQNPALDFMQMIQKRFATIFKGRADPTTEARFLEWKAAVKEIRDHPWLGSGLGKGVAYFDTTLYHPRTVTTRYIHNSYLFFLLNMGWVGLLAFLWLCVSFVFYGLRVFHSVEDPYYKGMVLGCWSAFIALLVAAFAGASLNDSALTIWAGFLMGTVTVIDRQKKVGKEKTSGLA